jgi:hypothetical protein
MFLDHAPQASRRHYGDQLIVWQGHNTRGGVPMWCVGGRADLLMVIHWTVTGRPCFWYLGTQFGLTGMLHAQVCVWGGVQVGKMLQRSGEMAKGNANGLTPHLHEAAWL